MKYVAFLDILGFKDTLSHLNQERAKEFISSFSSTIYSVWGEKKRDKIRGFIVSDSVIINTTDTSIRALEELLEIIEKICRLEFLDNNILLRGAIAKGKFDKIEANELSGISKGLIVGQAYVDAYLLEGTVKTIGIVLSEDVYQDTQNINLKNNNVVEESSQSNKHYILKYLDIDFLSMDGNLKKYILLAVKSNWLPHYYNTMYFALKNEKKEKKVLKLFSEIVGIIDEDKSSQNWRNLDVFIKNAFDINVNAHFQTRFLKYIRNTISNTISNR